jgi:hypothetical protein
MRGALAAVVAERMFNAYNEQGPNHWKTFDGRPVPRWSDTGEQVQAKWIAAAQLAVDAFVPATLGATVLSVEEIARVCHQVNKAYCAAIGDHSQPDWDAAPDWQRRSAIAGVKFHLENPRSNAAASHESWLEEKRRDGWKYGPVKDPEKKEHPCFVPYEALPTEQKAKDYLFLAVVRALTGR